jgi:DNA N-6-adenine-methyltransferase (Dam)/AT hook motif
MQQGELDFVTLETRRKSPQTRPRGRPRKHADHAARQRAYRRRLKVKVFHRRGSDVWSTPQDFFDHLDAEFHFTLDVCATAENAKCPRYFSPEQDGLAQDWGTAIVWMNCPYSG